MSRSRTLHRTSLLAGIPDELARFGDLVRSLDPEQLGSPTRCAGWTAAAVAGHVVGIVVDVSAGRLDGQGSPEVTARQADERAGRTASELANELARATPALTALLASLPTDAWDGPSLTDPRYTMAFAVEALWFDAYLHADDIRAAIGTPSERGSGLRCAVHHVAGYLEARGWRPATLAFEGIERIDVCGGGEEITGDPLCFVLAATGRADPSELGLDAGVDVYAD